ncbi:DNA invertase Pin-like site-specific DNA recombinase [Duganella sp. 1224]|uniref:Mor transcription activator family protein n=1 Tax=Duganella sp. 1224 TaxID=2587052 RepID=UPI0015C90E16|nr:Mor transcription activator family protein [Duganella sp. 1224]NYE62199.1 DNA invertase Pin-like site-specific DNA recombinase [Duganella sp. 1224]
MIEEVQCDIVTAMLNEVRLLLGDEVFHAAVEKVLEAKLRIDWGGQAVYVKKVAIDVHARRRAIRAKYDGTNRRQLQLEFGISRGQFYKDLRSGIDPAVESPISLERRLRRR